MFQWIYDQELWLLWLVSYRWPGGLSGDADRAQLRGNPKARLGPCAAGVGYRQLSGILPGGVQA